VEEVVYYTTAWPQNVCAKYTDYQIWLVSFVGEMCARGEVVRSFERKSDFLRLAWSEFEVDGLLHHKGVNGVVVGCHTAHIRKPTCRLPAKFGEGGTLKRSIIIESSGPDEKHYFSAERRAGQISYLLFPDEHVRLVGGKYYGSGNSLAVSMCCLGQGRQPQSDGRYKI